MGAVEGGRREKVRHAFAVDPPGPAEPTPEAQPVVDWVCQQVARRQMTTPGLIMLEVLRPLNWLGAQAMHVASPGVWAISRRGRHANYEHFAKFLEHRGSMEYLSRRIEHFENEYKKLEREQTELPELPDERGPEKDPTESP